MSSLISAEGNIGITGAADYRIKYCKLYCNQLYYYTIYCYHRLKLLLLLEYNLVEYDLLQRIANCKVSSVRMILYIELHLKV